MTLAQWERQTDESAQHTTCGTYVCADERTPLFSELWHLSDYRVSSRCGLTIWLIPRVPTSAELIDHARIVDVRACVHLCGRAHAEYLGTVYSFGTRLWVLYANATVEVVHNTGHHYTEKTV